MHVNMVLNGHILNGYLCAVSFQPGELSLCDHMSCVAVRGSVVNLSDFVTMKDICATEHCQWSHQGVTFQFCSRPRSKISNCFKDTLKTSSRCTPHTWSFGD